MKLDIALRGMFDAENKLRSVEGVNNPIFMSECMMRLSQFTGSVEEHLAEFEKDYEVQSAKLLKTFMIDQKLAVTAAEKRMKLELGEVKGQIVHLGRLTSSAWKQVGVIQSRINHLVREAQTQL